MISPKSKALHPHAGYIQRAMISNSHALRNTKRCLYVFTFMTNSPFADSSKMIPRTDLVAFGAASGG
jgi:hypothetical protein